jgi:hypothetical protein
MPGPREHVAAEGGAVRAARHRHDAVLHRHGELARVGPELAADHLVQDLLADLLVRAVEDRQHVGAGDDPDEMARRVRHGNPLDPADVHQPGGVLDRVLRGNRHGGTGHQVGRRDAVRLLLSPLAQDAAGRGLFVIQRLLGQHVRF